MSEKKDGGLDAKTELLVWLEENSVVGITCREVMVGEEDSRTEVRFWASGGARRVVEDWRAWRSVRRSEYDTSLGFEFRPSYAGLVRVLDSRAKEIVKRRRADGGLEARRLELEAELSRVNKELGRE